MSVPSECVIVIGAGAAGMMAAIRAASCGASVLLIERNDRPGVKLSITGKGRCNITNACEPEEVSFAGDGRFLRSALVKFPPRDVMAFFEESGVRLVTERGRRVFPESGKAADIVNALNNRLKELNVDRKRARITQLALSDGAVSGVSMRPDEITPGRAVIIATGGLSYPKTGSTGDGYTLARQAGHTIIPCAPSLVPLVSPDAYCAEMQGLSLRNVTLTMLDKTGKTLFREGPGEMLFTHFGLSGPLVLSASAHYKPGCSISIDLKPGLSEQQLDARILRDFQKYSARSFANALGELLHKRMIPVIISIAGIDPHKRTAEISKSERAALLSAIKRFPVSVSGTRPIDEAVVTRGGVCLREIDPKTMQSKLCKGLYFAGEVLDLDAYTGGYNLQIAWSSGYAAGESAAGADFR